MEISVGFGLLVSLSFLGSSFAQGLIVDIPTLGRIRGSQMLSSSGRNFLAFRGIRYAQPPVGNLRFREPVPAHSWGETILDATIEGPACTQFDTTSNLAKGVEDCLALNVYSPQLNSKEGNGLPVMVWIHGGAWIEGSGNGETDIYGPGYILDRDVVFVTLNYRLGPLGFLSTEDAVAPGNYGLLDQSLALKWVHDHISHFGGDSDSITIFGESAGGSSVEFHIFSPYSKGLFHRAIAQSGTANCPWSLQTNVGEYTRMLAEYMRCPTTSSQEIVDCLRTKDDKDLAEYRKTITMPFAFRLYPVAFGPRIDSERTSPFISDHPERLLVTKQFNPVPYIIGLTQDEGALFTATLATIDGKNLEVFNKDPIESVRYSIGMEKDDNGYEIAKKVYDNYFAPEKNNGDVAIQYGELSSDFGFFKCIDDSAKLFSTFSEHPTYYYNYAHQAKLSFTNFLNVPADAQFGVCHGDELFMMFKSNVIEPLTEPDDIKMSTVLLDLWTSFAANGVPKSQQINGNWLPINGDEARYLNIDAHNSKLVNDTMPFESRLPFWNSLLSSSSTSNKDEL